MDGCRLGGAMREWGGVHSRGESRVRIIHVADSRCDDFEICPMLDTYRIGCSPFPCGYRGWIEMNRSALSVMTFDVGPGVVDVVGSCKVV